MYYHLFNPSQLPCDETNNDAEILQLFESCLSTRLRLTISTNLQDITSLKDGQTMAIYLKYHNIGITCEKIHQKVQLSFYPCLLDNADVLKHSHIQLTYPSKIIMIDESELNTIDFTNMISFANADMDIAYAHSIKGTSLHAEIRANRDPTAFLQLLFDRLTYKEVSNEKTITKHYHDEIRWNNSKACFRRSGLLFFLKAAVKHTFINTLDNGELLYKQFIIDMLLHYHESNSLFMMKNMLDWANIKITRKIKKFKQIYNSTYFDDKLAFLKAEFSPLEVATSTIFPIKNITKHDCKFDVIIDTTLEPIIINGDTQYPSYTDHHLRVHQRLQKYMKINNINNTITPENLFSKFSSMIKKCENTTLKHDPLFISRSVHCCLKILQLMHMSLSVRHKTMNRQILRKEDIKLFRFILTENHQERKSLHDIEYYFMRHQDKAPFVLDNSHDFALQYVQDHLPEWTQWKSTIEHREQVFITQKNTEYKTKMKQYNNIVSKKNPFQCHKECELNPHRDRSKNNYRCQYHKFEDQREIDKKITISCHECMLPVLSKNQQIVAFEYICPKELLDFRDMIGQLLCVFHNDVYGAKETYPRQDSIYETWTKPRHHDYLQSDWQIQKSFIQLTSTTKSVEVSHYDSKHITAISSNLIQDNCWNIRFSLDISKPINESYFERKTMFPSISHNPYCVGLSKYTLEQSSDDIDKNKMSLIRLRDSANPVIASFESVDHSITPEEYQTIATIRVGEYLQLENIWNAIKNDAPIMDSMVITIIKQAIYAFGNRHISVSPLIINNTSIKGIIESSVLTFAPECSQTNYYRTHVGLHDKTFLKNLKDTINKWINDYADTWNKYKYMESIIVVLNLIQQEISCDCEYVLIRNICKKWITTIVEQELFEIVYQLYSIMIQTYRYLEFTQTNIVEYLTTLERYYFYKNKIGNKDTHESYIMYDNLNKIKSSSINYINAFQSYLAETNNPSRQWTHHWSYQWLIINETSCEQSMSDTSCEYAICFLTGEYRINGLVCNTIPIELRNTSKYKTLFGSVSLNVTKKKEYYVHKYEKEVQCDFQFYQNSIIQVFATRYMFLETLNINPVEHILIPDDIAKLYKWIDMDTKVIEFRTHKFDPMSTKYRYVDNAIQTNHMQSIVVKNHQDIMVALDSMTDKTDIIVTIQNNPSTLDKSDIIVTAGQSFVFQLLDDQSSDVQSRDVQSSDDQSSDDQSSDDQSSDDQSSDDQSNNTSEYTGNRIIKALYLETLDGWIHKEFDVFGQTVPKLTLKCYNTNETFIMLKRRNYLSQIDSFNFFTYTVNPITQMLDTKSREAYIYLGYTFGFSNCATTRDPFTQEYGKTMSQKVLENYGYPSDVYNTGEQQLLDWIADLSPSRKYYPKHLQEMEVVIFSVDWLSSSDWYVTWVKEMNKQHNIICDKNNITKWKLGLDTIDHLNERAYQLREKYSSEPSDEQAIYTIYTFPLLEQLKVYDKVKDYYCDYYPIWGTQLPRIYHTFYDFIKDHPIETWHSLENKHTVIIDSLVQISLSTTYSYRHKYEWLLQYLIYQSITRRRQTNWLVLITSDYVKCLPSRLSLTLHHLQRKYIHHHTDTLWSCSDDENKIEEVNGKTKQYLQSVDGISGLNNINNNLDERTVIYDVNLTTGKQNQLHPKDPRNNWLKFLKEKSTNSSTTCDTLTQMLVNTIQNSHTIHHMNDLPTYWKWVQLATSKIIRPKQIKIARHMIDSESSLQTQLNMGEGKTSIIMPMLCMHVLHETDTIPRINVLKPLLKTNLEYFHCVFGFMGIKLYNDYCDRSSKPQISYNELNTSVKPIMITSWESRMSRLILNNIQPNMPTIDTPMFSEILDESDEIFHPNNSLVYPTGDPQLVNGGAYRWKTWFAIFEALADIIHHYKLQDTYPEDIMVQPMRTANQFPIITITNFSCGFRKKLNKLLLDTIFNNKTTLKKFTDKDKDVFNKDIFPHEMYTGEKQHVMLTLFGAMRYKILHDSMLKRHRVNYGIDRKRSSLVAVPFRGKEYPSYNSEYSQPDAIIALTCQSYYLDGLTNNQVYQVLKDIIAKKVLNVGTTPIQYQTLNIEDPLIFQQYCQQYRYNMNFCNYYMNKFVFPTFAKQFPEQYQATTWNLTGDTPTMGFSGTNGMQNLLPPKIAQHDLQEVKMTNAYMDDLIATQQLCNNQLMEQFDNPLDAIMSPRYSQTYQNLNVLIDAGGDVDDSGNVVAHRWLRSRPDMLACLYYFNDEQYIVDQHDNVQKRDQSNFAKFLNKVLIYLDDQHTRGVDLKIPDNTTAMVTIGDGVTRDKLMQACMRMRGLIRNPEVQKIHGEHHVTFFQSPKVRGVMKKNNTSTILEYCYGCTNDMIKKMLYIHGMNGRKYLPDNIITATPEFLTLECMYGKTVKNQLLSDIFTHDQHIRECIHKHCTTNNICPSRLKHLFSCNQEQERELEQELEEERQVERPPPYKANPEYIRPCIKNLLHNKMECQCHTIGKTPCWESCNKYIGLNISDNRIQVNVSHETLHGVVTNTSTMSNKVHLPPNIRNQLVWCYSMKINNIQNYLFMTHYEANYLKANNIHTNRLSSFIPQLFNIDSSRIPALTWNHSFESVEQKNTIMTMFLVLRSRFVPDPLYLNKFIRQFNIPTLIEYYKTLEDDTDVKNSIDKISIH